MKQNELFNKCCENIDPKTREEVWKQMDKELGRTELEQAAEEAALKLYPKEETIMYHSAFGKFEFDKNAGQREAYMEGFRYGAKWMAEQIKGGSK